MQVQLTPHFERKLVDLAATTGRAPVDLLEDALAQTREMLDRRYDDLASGRVTPIDGEAFFESLRQREDELIKTRTP